ncbi:PP2C family protein-serine/threonine phosphatase [Haloarcula nitratireducens]|uniref:Protein phosphatase 2C domain-containing protein n=1 Tax=Haloarcula nitratireducens TaxID=2487749 RepID=A0AAW4P9W5_9EURY|nr:protein phosphatase 2C domain-containing protein [Halomicroarcula nitratireducens]MBX0294547.1 protein phosphatase 2C domain-containing protein [Halomicroarcula nitratireducens]
MRYATNYDIGDRKRGRGINEDSLSLTVFEEGHRGGYRGQRRPSDSGDVADADTNAGDSGDEDTSEGDAESEREGRPANRSAGVFVLADGAGGHDAGDAASYIATTVVAERLAPVAIRSVRGYPDGFDVDIGPEVLPETLGPEDVQAAIESAVVEAHRDIIRYADDSGSQSYTTLVAGVYADGKLHLGWVGDSRAYLVNHAREEIVRLTKDHAVVEEMADAGEIDDVEAHVHPNGNEITRALGGSGHEDPERAFVDVDTRTVRLYAEDTVLATSDGLIDAQTDAPELYEEYVDAGRSEAAAETVREAVVTDDEIRDVLLDADSLSDAAREYVSLANDRGGKDNISVLVFDDDALPATPAAGGLPVRAADPDEDVADRETLIMSDE